MPIISTAFALALQAEPAQPPSLPVFGCDAPGGRTCYFTLLLPGGAQSFSLQPGSRRAVTGAVPGRDSYVVSFGVPNYGDVSRCRSMAAMSRGCERKIVDAGYND